MDIQVHTANVKKCIDTAAEWTGDPAICRMQGSRCLFLREIGRMGCNHKSGSATGLHLGRIGNNKIGSKRLS